MLGEDESTESIGAKSRLQAELSELESGSRGARLLLMFMVALLGLSALSLILPQGLWRSRPLEIRIPSQYLFIFLLAGFVVCIYLVRHESELWKLRLLTLRQVLAAQSERSASLIDTVTNVFTRSFLRELLQREIARAERNHRPLGLVMCDVNNFKQVNDRYGHLVGDDVLAQVAGILKVCLRGSDHVVRYGGDEFLLILPETDEAGARIVQSRIRDKVAELDLSHHLGNIPISVSMGMHLHVSGQSAERDIAEADARMYQDKQVATTANETGAGVTNSRLNR